MDKKTQLPKEIQKLLQEVEQKEQEELEKIKQEVKSQHKGDWDVYKDEPISFFDINLSYELTGYRPINETQGIDFDPDWFTEARRNFTKTGNYTQFRKGTKAYADFWTEEYIRCREGMTSHGYTITGNNYFFLNYYQLPSTETEKAGTARSNIFPKFLSYQYEYFHYFELCKALRKNVCLMKSRGIGFSEINAAIIANQYNSFRESVSLLTAQNENYVRKTLEKIWSALTFLNDRTNGGFLKLTQAVNTAFKKRASYFKVVNGQQIETGWKSQIEGIIADDDSKIRGDRVDLLVLEEAGHNKNLRKSFIKGEALCTIGGHKFGVISAGGTGGDSGPAMEGLRDIYYNPVTYDVLPMKHSYSANNEEVLTAFFIPSFAAVYESGFIDHRGVCDKEKAKAYYEEERAKRAASPQALIDYSAEYCFNAEEAFALEGENKFNKVNIAEQLTLIRALKQKPPQGDIQHGTLKFKFKNGEHKVARSTVESVVWNAVDAGKIRILEHPQWLLEPQKDPENGAVVWSPPPRMHDLYVAGIDGIDMGAAQTSEYTKDPSDFCMVVKRRIFGMSDPQYVAIYKDRPQDIREAYEIAIALAMYYNCKINIEATRMSLVTWARDRNLLNYFMKRPSSTYPDISKKKTSQYGAPATLAVIDHQTDLIRDFVNDYCYTIWFDDMLDELNRYTIENKRKFDIIAALGMCELADEELSGVTPRSEIVETEEIQDIGYYYDENGVKHYGVIPKQVTFETHVDPFYNPTYTKDIGIKTSDTRYYVGFTH